MSLDLTPPAFAVLEKPTVDSAWRVLQMIDDLVNAMDLAEATRRYPGVFDACVVSLIPVMQGHKP